MKQCEFIGNQGDVHIFKVDEFPKGERVSDEQIEDKVLAYGEVTGHAHKVVSGSVELFKIMGNGMIGMEVKEKAKIEHGLDPKFKGTEPDQDYHHPAVLAPGKYLVGIVEETDHMSGVTKRVVD